jgi:opacity protein-like surface antigen
MKNILLVAATSLALTSTAAFADRDRDRDRDRDVPVAQVAENFDNTVASVTANIGRYSFTVEGTEDTGFTQLEVGANVLSYGINDNLNSTLDVYGVWYHSDEQVGLGVDYTVTYSVNDLSVYGVANLEYVANENDFNDGDFFTAPTLGASYQLTDKVGAYTEVTYAWNASDDFSKVGGEVELGANFALADNIALNPALVRSFDTANDTTQLRVGLVLDF